MTEVRCRACTVLGGMTVETEQEASAVSEIPRVELAIKTGERAPIRVGDEVKLPPCVRDLGQYVRAGRACPRVELAPENYEAIALFGLSARDNARHLAVPYLDSVFPEQSDERRRVIQRVMNTLMHAEVSKLLRPPDPPQRKGRA